ncbi:NAD(P)(+) transhydrogenase (Re/Si-specific) subunit beta [Paraburkholderia sp. MM5384-R2]|uniref:NAD(P)(+) transhydrogenase (Re/Si-specific) subunit beta n=1 Tax=Paraburkholderia sp. MM5384-R2 TaxID=2723097 RepID=UPI001844177A|nr:NAD(P)(+) transhydrogenase (Re/Si-specific) subunit beta [Paraburkholderia sp. MM5384-R2]MBB5503218.1 NAD(P) transhydrogenase subunit beta [Paraburkholderia sp. MM5384-R2]
MASLGIGMGLAAISGGFAGYLSATAYAKAAVERVELCAVVFIGALIFAPSTIAFCKLRGAIGGRARARPGYTVVNLTALVLCVCLGYGFVTEPTQTFGLAALLAMSGLAAALGAHLMMAAAADVPLHALAAPHGHRSHARCGLVQRRGGLGRFEWRDDQMHPLLGDEFAQPWALRDDTQDVVRTSAYRSGVEWRYRGRYRSRQRYCARRNETQTKRDSRPGSRADE